MWGKLAMIATQDIVLKNYFKSSIVLGQENLPLEGAVVLAPTHRSRWDALMLTMAAGRRVTKRDCRFMVTLSEMQGIQGWFLNRLGCYPVDKKNPSLLSLRYSIDLLSAGMQLVVFPEGQINRRGKSIKIESGLIRLSQLAFRKGVKVKVLPIGLGYSEVIPKPFSKAAICFGEPMSILKTGRKAANEFDLELASRMHTAEECALKAVGRFS
ncbi:Phospholipid and glycerol acyltransferase [Prochlorococcus sp. SS52]|nr:Phospholipid and glycerol acyltransferase [Prochlorococcus marinus str. SS2]KGG37002.1 Phospholipid and glycerol acyltransferase [Prochlorococcus sp. SS52]